MKPIKDRFSLKGTNTFSSQLDQLPLLSGGSVWGCGDGCVDPVGGFVGRQVDVSTEAELEAGLLGKSL